MSSIIDLDLIKQVRETIDWLIGKHKGISNSQKKAVLNQIANQISTLAVNKAAYLVALKQELGSANETVDLYKITSALKTARTDTEKLNDLLTEFDLDAAKFTFSLKHGLEKLTRLKQLKLKELEELVAEDTPGSAQLNDIIHELEAFEHQWIDLGKEIDDIIEKKL